MNRLAIETGFLLSNLSEEEPRSKGQWEITLSVSRHHTFMITNVMKSIRVLVPSFHVFVVRHAER